MSTAAARRVADPVPTTAAVEDREVALTALVSALRAESHEYANRIHAISGLLALDMTDAAEGLLSDFMLEHVSGGAALLEAIGSPGLVGLIVSKRAAGRSKGVSIQVDEESCLEELPSGLTEIDAISVVGNFIDNAIDAVDSMSAERRLVEVGIYQDDRETRLRVADHGPGFEPSVRGHAYEQGCTSKPDHHGFGLAIVSAVLDRCGGDLAVSCTSAGSVFEARFPAT